MPPNWDLLGDRVLSEDLLQHHAVSQAGTVGLPSDDAGLLAVLAVAAARYSGSDTQLLGWSDGGPWRPVQITVEPHQPFEVTVAAAQEALRTHESGPVPSVGIGRSAAPADGAPDVLAVRGDGTVRRAVPLYGEQDVERFVGHLETLAAGRGSDTPVAHLPMLSVQEQSRMMAGNAVGPLPEADPTLTELILEQVRAHPDTVAVRSRGDEVTYAQLWSRSGAVAARLSSGTLVGVWADRTVDCVIALVGVLRAGAAYVALEPRYPPARLQAVADAAGLRDVVGAADPSLGLRVHPVDTVDIVDTVGPDDDASTAGPARPADLAYVMFTSGSTGAPKGVMIEHASVVNLLLHMRKSPGLRPGETMLGVTTPAFDLSVPDLFLPLVSGATLVLADPSAATDGRRLAEELARYRPDLMQATPATWRMLLSAGWAGAPTLRIVCGGEGYDAALARTLAARVGGVWNFYGPTETTVWSTSCRLDAATDDPVPIGRPVRGTACYVLDERGEPVPPGVRGEITIAGRGVARGYLNRSDLTAGVFVPCRLPGAPSEVMYRTGDLGRTTPSGELSFAGRRDLQVKINGFRVELGEVEAVVGELPGVAQAVAVIRSTDDVTRLLCYVTASAPGRPLDPVTLRAEACRTLPPQAVPAVIVVLDEFPLSVNGKVDRRALPEPAERTGEPLVGAFEELVAGVWADVLAVPSIYADDDVFALGAYSLDVGRIALRLSTELALEVSPGLIFGYSTVRALAAGLLELAAEDHPEMLAAVEGQ